MKEKDFEVIKSEKEFHRNYSLHDIAQEEGEKFIKSLGFIVKPFGEDRRHEAVWEAGEDKPDCIIVSKDNKNICLLDWKGKKSKGFRVNERAYNSYIKISKKLELPLIIASAFINSNKKIESFSYAIFPDDSAIVGNKQEWDGNITVNFKESSFKDFYKILYDLNKL